MSQHLFIYTQNKRSDQIISELGNESNILGFTYEVQNYPKHKMRSIGKILEKYFLQTTEDGERKTKRLEALNVMYKGKNAKVIFYCPEYEAMDGRVPDDIQEIVEEYFKKNLFDKSMPLRYATSAKYLDNAKIDGVNRHHVSHWIGIKGPATH